MLFMLNVIIAGNIDAAIKEEDIAECVWCAHDFCFCNGSDAIIQGHEGKGQFFIWDCFFLCFLCGGFFRRLCFFRRFSFFRNRFCWRSLFRRSSFGRQGFFRLCGFRWGCFFRLRGFWGRSFCRKGFSCDRGGSFCRFCAGLRIDLRSGYTGDHTEHQYQNQQKRDTSFLNSYHGFFLS